MTTWHVYADGSFSVLGRIEDQAAALITQANVSSITCYIRNTHTGAAVGSPLSLVVADTVFDALQLDGRWSVDATGYNFRHDVAANVLVEPQTTYRLEYKLVTTSGDVIRDTVHLQTKDLANQ
jgi:hypothetical protein